MGIQNRFDVRHITWAMGDGFHNNQILWKWQGNADTADIDPFGPGHELLFEGQRAEHDIHINTTRLMMNQKYMDPVGELGGIGSSRFEPEPRAQRQKIGPSLRFKKDQHIHIPRYPRAP